MEPRGRVALVTGAGVRLGRALALALAREGAHMLVHYNRSAEDAEETVREARALGAEAVALQADLSDLDQVDRLAREAEGVFGQVDILVNNASVFPPERLDEVTAEIWQRALGVNVTAPFFLTQRLGAGMRARGEGLVVNLADLAGLQPWAAYAAHSVSKAALVHLTRVAARALAPEVRVAAIAPGTVLPPEELSAGEIQRLAERSPLRRIGAPEDVVAALLYLVRSDFVTGEVLVVDGGRSLLG